MRIVAMISVLLALPWGTTTAGAEDGERPPPIPRASYRLDVRAPVHGLPAPYLFRLVAERNSTPNDLVVGLVRHYGGPGGAKQIHQWSTRHGFSFACHRELSHGVLRDHRKRGHAGRHTARGRRHRLEVRHDTCGVSPTEAGPAGGRGSTSLF